MKDVDFVRYTSLTATISHDNNNRTSEHASKSWRSDGPPSCRGGCGLLIKSTTHNNESKKTQHDNNRFGTLILGNQNDFLTIFIWVALKDNVRLARILWITSEVCSNQGFRPGQWENYQKQMPWRNLMPKRYLHCPMTCKVMQRNAWEDIANLRIKQLSSYTKSRRHAWMIINLDKIKWDQLENCPSFAHKCCEISS